MKKLVFAAVFAAVIAVAAPAAAYADTEGYTPVSPTGPSISGSAVDPSCGDGNAMINYSVTFTDPSGTVTDAAATLVLTDGTQSMELALGNLVDNHIEGSIPWPSESWTRTGDVSAELRAGGASLPVPLEYLPATVDTCDPAAASSGAATLSATGNDVPVVPIALVGGSFLLLGAGFLLVRRLRQH